MLLPCEDDMSKHVNPNVRWTKTGRKKMPWSTPAEKKFCGCVSSKGRPMLRFKCQQHHVTYSYWCPCGVRRELCSKHKMCLPATRETQSVQSREAVEAAGRQWGEAIAVRRVIAEGERLSTSERLQTKKRARCQHGKARSKCVECHGNLVSFWCEHSTIERPQRRFRCVFCKSKSDA